MPAAHRSSLARAHALAACALACAGPASLVWASLVWGPSSQAASADDEVDYATQIAPIFETRCARCHGASKQKNGLRLDRRESALRGGDSGPVIAPGRRHDSLLYERISADDELDRMPPEEPLLSAEEIELIARWIDEGARGSETREASAPGAGSAHWAFRPVRGGEVPEVPESDRVVSPIDAFVLAELEARGIEPSPAADRTTLIRRLHLDLLGLPPTPAEVEAFLEDDRPDAYERLVERLLESPHFGERWARAWLDLARYADSDGYEKDNLRPDAWRWRDWVIEAINADLPYDRFVIEQLAGDLLPGATAEQRLATGFHRNALTNLEGGVDPEEFRVAAVADRVDTTGTVFLGLTLGCARCHTHKYDPITQREYYGLFAFFDSDDEVHTAVPATRAEREQWREATWEHQARQIELESQLAALEPEVAAELAALEQLAGAPQPSWTTLDPQTYLAEGGSALEELDDHSLLAGGLLPQTERYSIVVDTTLAPITGFRLEVLPAGDPPLVGRTSHGNFVLSELEVEVAPRGRPHEARPVTLDAAWADFSQDGWAVAGAIDGDRKTGWALQPHYGVAHTAVFRCAEPIGFDGGTLLSFHLGQYYGYEHTIAHLRLSATTTNRRIVTLPTGLLEVLALAPEARSEEQRARLRTHALGLSQATRELHATFEQHRSTAPPEPAPRAATLALGASPRTTRILQRGDFLRPGDSVQPGVPAALNELRARGEVPDRLDLARWLVSPENPLTARVEVNRIWARLFGRGLVASPDDFGTRGEPPSHPELLDWLARELAARGWSRKAMIREIVGSSTYRQSSRARPELDELDPDNALLARQGRFRVEAEVVRDLWLAASGLLYAAVGGPSVRPPLPADVAKLGYADSVRWPVSDRPQRYRRGLYIQLRRTVPYPMLVTFDCADASVSTASRDRSDTPLQALTTLNDPVFVDCARAFAARLAGEGTASDEARVEAAFRRALGRAPDAQEARVVLALLESQRARYERDPEAASAFAGVDEGEGEGEGEAAERAAWTAVGRALMNTDEFLTRE